MAEQNRKRSTPKNAFKKGQSGNPGGRPKMPEEFKELAKTYSVEALKKVIGIMQDPDADNKDRLRASEIIMDRAWGKATQAISGPDEGPIQTESKPDLSGLSVEELRRLAKLKQADK